MPSQLLLHKILNNCLPSSPIYLNVRENLGESKMKQVVDVVPMMIGIDSSLESYITPTIKVSLFQNQHYGNESTSSKSRDIVQYFCQVFVTNLSNE